MSQLCSEGRWETVRTRIAKQADLQEDRNALEHPWGASDVRQKSESQGEKGGGRTSVYHG